MEDCFIVNQIKSGNTQAFKILVLRHQKPVFRYLRSFGLRPTIVEELAQETFVRIFKNLSEFDSSKASFSTWVLVIAKNLALNELARHFHQKEEIPQYLPEVADYETPFTLLEREQISNRLHELMNMIPFSFRNALTLFHINEMSLEEIAQVEGCSVGTVKSRIFRGKEMLKMLSKEKLREGQ